MKMYLLGFKAWFSLATQAEAQNKHLDPFVCACACANACVEAVFPGEISILASVLASLGKTRLNISRNVWKSYCDSIPRSVTS